jgi:3alpha(or 20beta)-hydroxysteroid dehydrogenase
MKRLQGKVAIVTGASQGMGEHHARAMAAEGAKVVLADILTDRGQWLAKQIGQNACFVHHDVGEAQSWKSLVSETEKCFGAVTVLVNNAGVSGATPIEDLAEDTVARFLRINVVGVLLGMQAVISSMRSAGGGSIINISSVAGLRAAQGAIAYTTTKFAVTGMTKTAAVDLAKYGIRVNSVHPGLVMTPLLQANIEYLHMLVQRVPLGRAARADELSPLAIFLASDESSYCTGGEFVADGGLTCQQ